MCTVATEAVSELLVNVVPGITRKSMNACQELEKYLNVILGFELACKCIITRSFGFSWVNE